MKNHSWMYKDSPQGLQMMNYYNEINYAISNSRNISRDVMKYSYKRYKNKKFLHSDMIIRNCDFFICFLHILFFSNIQRG